MPLTKKDEKFLKNLGQRIRSIREDNGWTLEEVEEMGFPSWRHLQRIETGKNVNITTLKRLSVVFGVRLADFFE